MQILSERWRARGAACLVLAATLLAGSLLAATYEVGPGQTYTNLGSVPWMGLAAGDSVNIHYRPGGYHEIVMLSNSGTSNAPITLNGIPDPATGALPTIDGANAVTASSVPWRSLFFNFEGVIVVSRALGTAYGYIPSWIVIQNLHLQNADPGHALTRSDGVVTNFDSFACAIYVEFAQHLVVRGCELNGCCNGFFCNSKDSTTNELSADILIERCWIHDNGYPGNYGVHNIYTEAKGVTFQYNLIGPLRPGADGEQIKDRSSGTVLRYNMMIVAPGPGTAFWFEQPQGGAGVIDLDPAYRTNYVYGNVFYNPPGSSSIQMFRYDALGIEGQPRNGTLYFYNNTVVNYANQSQRYGTALFNLPSHSEVLQWNVHDVVDCRNNIFAALPTTTGAAPTLVSLLVSDDSTIRFGTNWISPGAQFVQLPYLATNFYGTFAGTNQLLWGDRQGKNNPGFMDLASTNFHLLSSSRAIDAAGPQAPAVAGSVYDLTLEYLYPTNAQARNINGNGLDLGALEGISTNFVPARLTLSAGGPQSAVISWPTLPAGGVLQQKAALDSPNWTGATNAISVVGGQNQAVVPLSSSSQFFRLSYP
jgi:hypothetical protein